MVLTSYLLILPSCIALWFLSRAISRSKPLPYPPGPPPTFIIGNLLDWPKGNAWLKTTQWRKVYGDIVHLGLLGQHIVVLNSFEDAKELLDQKIYSDRPTLMMAGELMGFVASIILTRYGEYWKLLRKLAHTGMQKAVIPNYWQNLEADAREFVQLIQDRPSEYRTILRYCLGKVIMKTTYGIDVQSAHDKYITLAEKTHEDLAYALIPGSFLVDVMPFLRYVPAWMPGASFQLHAARARRQGEDMVNLPYLHVKNAWDAGKAPLSFVSSLLDDQRALKRPLDSEYQYAVKWTAGTLYGAGAEPAFATLTVFFLAMAINPEIQRKAQRELDEVVGRERPPSFDDIDKLPYLEAILKETLRWHPPVPLGVARMVTCDNQVRGYHIPAKATIVPNVWGMSQDPEFYENPSVFQPERFTKSPPDLDPFEYVFGFGRRGCVGVHYASALLYIIMASVLAACDIDTKDAEGNVIPVNPEFSPKFTSYAEEFPCRIVPRQK